MKVIVHPMVLAGALGLLGPAALTDDEPTPTEGLAGCWSRSVPGNGSPLLSDDIEVIPVADRLIIDSGLELSHDTNRWVLSDTNHARQELMIGDTLVIRDFTSDGGNLSVRTVVRTPGEHTEYTDHYTRFS